MVLGDRAAQTALARKACAALPGAEWHAIPPNGFDVTVLSGAMTNAMFLCRIPGGQAAIVRIFGLPVPLIDRDLEMAVFDELARSGVGPGMLGIIYDDGSVGGLELKQQGKTPVGRIEEFLEGWITLGYAHYNAHETHLAAVFARLASCHSVSIASMPREPRIFNDIAAQAASVALAAVDAGPERWETLVEARVDVAAAASALLAELKEIKLAPEDLGFCHNDLQHGNVMMHEPSGRYTLIDFEYAGYNPIYYDLANVWNEVPANYEEGCSPVGFKQDFVRGFPSAAVQCISVASYLSAKTGRAISVDSERVVAFVKCCQPWVRASHLFWGLWGILQARERRDIALKPGEFDYAAYAANRLNALTSCP